MSAADLVLDLHSALDGCNIAPFVYIDPDDDEGGHAGAAARAPALAFGTPYVYCKERGQKLGTSDMSHSLRAQADAAGKPAINAEMGESMRVTSAFVPIGVRGVSNVLRHLGIEDGRARSPPPEQRVFRAITLAHSDRGGGLRWQVDLGDDVRAGQPIAEIVDVFGEPVETIEAPAEGFVLRQMLFGAVATGAEIAWIAT